MSILENNLLLSDQVVEMFSLFESHSPNHTRFTQFYDMSRFTKDKIEDSKGVISQVFLDDLYEELRDLRLLDSCGHSFEMSTLARYYTHVERGILRRLYNPQQFRNVVIALLLSGLSHHVDEFLKFIDDPIFRGSDDAARAQLALAMRFSIFDDKSLEEIYHQITPDELKKLGHHKQMRELSTQVAIQVLVNHGYDKKVVTALIRAAKDANQSNLRVVSYVTSKQRDEELRPTIESYFSSSRDDIIQLIYKCRQTLKKDC